MYLKEFTEEKHYFLGFRKGLREFFCVILFNL